MTKPLRLWPDAVDAWFADSPHLTRNSRDRYESVLRSLQREHPTKSLADFVEADLVAYCYQPTVAGTAPASWTIVARRTALKGLFGWATGEGLLLVDPSVRLNRKVPDRPRKQRRSNWLTPEQVGALMAAIERQPEGPRERDRAAVSLMLTTGLRVEETSRLRWHHVDLAGRVLWVADGKGGKAADVPLPTEVIEPLFGWRSQAAKGLGRPPADDPVLPRMRSVFTSGRGTEHTWVVQWDTPVGRMGLYNRVKALGREIGVPSLAPHDLRRTYAGTLEAAGVPIQEISRLLRHSNVGTTQRYLDDNPRKRLEAVANVRFGVGGA